MNTFERLKWNVTHDPCALGDRLPYGAVTSGTPVRVFLRVHDDVICDIADVAIIVDERGEERRWRLERCAGGFYATVELEPSPHVAFYRFEVECADEETFSYVPRADGRSTAGELVQAGDGQDRGFQISVYDPAFSTPEWFAGAVMYQVLPDRFARGESGVNVRGVDYHRNMARPVHLHDDWEEPIAWKAGQAYDPVEFYGGTLQGIAGKLDYLASLGVEALYLNPVFEARSNHRYDTADYERIDPLLGTNDDFKTLVENARARGIRIVLDAVLSHTGDDSRYFNAHEAYPQPGAAQGEQSPFRSWYDFTAQENGAPYRCWWGDPSLPEVDERDESWQRYMLGDSDIGAAHDADAGIMGMWLDAGAGGYRYDVADEVPDDVLQRIRTTVKRVDPEAIMIGEVWEDATTKESYGTARTYALGVALDSVMNYPLRDALVGFANGTSDAYQLATFLKLQQANYPQPLYRCLMNLLSSHDVERIRTVLALGTPIRGLDREQQAALTSSVTAEQDKRAARLQRMLAGLLFALPGAPCVYYGDEAGMTGGADPFCRAPFPQSAVAQKQRPDCGCDLTDAYRKLGMARKGSTVLKKGSLACAAIDENVICIIRSLGDQVPPCIIVANRGSAGKRVVADLRTFNDPQRPSRKVSLPATAGSFEDGILSLDVPPCSTVYAFMRFAD